jgi:hypothetical protein
MIYKIKPAIYNTSTARLALYKILTGMGIPFNYVDDGRLLSLLTIEVEDEDALVLQLLDIGVEVRRLIVNGDVL